MLLRLPLFLFILLLSIVGCEQQDKETNTKSPPGMSTPEKPAMPTNKEENTGTTGSDTTPGGETDAKKTEPDANKAAEPSTDTPAAGGEGATETKPDKETTDNAH
ncbi:hypothetical protein THII_3952 [Thioploca ingrica]|uniref:Secreted protein n=1 Tax=Thioploca ingrica TaxID=40754 RepID=A0A090AKW6_9GAMM|nr:hypothetical protein THII_3952 [Thioploca ingrica]